MNHSQPGPLNSQGYFPVLANTVRLKLALGEEGNRAVRSTSGGESEMVEFLGGIQKGGVMKVVDPVCKMTIDAEKAAASSEYKGQTIYFCAKVCKAKFDQNPEKYSAK